MPSPRGNAPNLRTVRIIWLALLISVLLYGVLAMVVRPAEQPLSGTPAIFVLHVIAIPALLGAYLVPKFLDRGAADEALRDAMTTPPSDNPSVPPKLFVGLIARWAMLESVAIFGLMAALLGGDPRLFFPLGIVSVAGMLLSYPGESIARRA